MAKKRRGRPPKQPTTKQIARAGESIIKQRALLRPMIREACRTGMVEAIEHCSNFWSVADGYKKYIDHQVKSQTEAMMAAVKTALREELATVRRKRKSS